MGVVTYMLLNETSGNQMNIVSYAQFIYSPTEHVSIDCVLDEPIPTIERFRRDVLYHVHYTGGV